MPEPSTLSTMVASLTGQWPATPRSSGILLHPTSLPGPYGIGELGDQALEFINFLASAEQNLWQIMPLGPTGYGDSPYQSFSAFAGNPLLIGLAQLAQAGWLSHDDLQAVPPFPYDRVDFGPVITWRNEMLRRAYARFRDHAAPAQQRAVATFHTANQAWLDDFALFMALKERYQSAWSDWPTELATRQPQALKQAQRDLGDDIARHIFYQYEFDRQWSVIHRYATEKGVAIIGDIPIFVAFDSADAWAHPELFYFDETGRPTAVAGVPPDYFSPTGQLWGNPLYRWDVLADTGYQWWIERFRQAFRWVDIVRLDHFRGFAAYWCVPADEETAINGTWEPGPGDKMFKAVRAALGNLPIIAEDLGVITPDVNALREGEGFPGMRVLQFAFTTDGANPYLPHNHVPNCFVYTGTHDNDTTVGWFWKAPEGERAAVLEYTGTHGEQVNWDLIRLALMSVARWAVFPMQDLIGAGSEARMNTPGQGSGNWGWRLTHTPGDAHERLRRLTRVYGRGPVAAEQAAEAERQAAEGVDLGAASKGSANKAE